MKVVTNLLEIYYPHCAGLKKENRVPISEFCKTLFIADDYLVKIRSLPPLDAIVTWSVVYNLLFVNVINHFLRSKIIPDDRVLLCPAFASFIEKCMTGFGFEV